MDCKDFNSELVCFFDGTSYRNLVAHYEYGLNNNGKAIIVATRYTTPDGVVVDTSIGSVVAGACVIESSIFVKTDCTTITEKVVTQRVEAVIDQVVKVEIQCDKEEVDAFQTNWLPICVNNEQWYVAEEYKYNNDTQVKEYVGKIYKQFSVGVPTTTAPISPILDGICKDCKTEKQFEFVYYKTERKIVVDNFVGFQTGINADFNQPIPTNYEMYFVIDGVAQLGNAAGINYGADYPFSATSLQDFANYYNNHLANTAPKDTWIVVDNAGVKSLIIQGSNTIPPNHNWADMVTAHYNIGGQNDYNIYKSSPQLVQAEVVIPESCRKIQLLKEIDCNNNLTTLGFEINGTPIQSFDSNLLFNVDIRREVRDICADMKSGEIWNLKEVTETSPCGTTTITYFDDDTSPMTDVTTFYDKIRHNGECDCCLDIVNESVLKAQLQTYGASAFGSRIFANFALDKFSEWQIQWQVKVYKNGNVIFTSPLSPQFTSQANSQTWLNSVCGAYITLDTFNGAVNGSNIISLPSATLPDEYLIVLTETATGNSPNIGVPNSPVDYAYTNKGTTFGLGGDLADCFGNSIDWANRTVWSWYS